MRQNPSLKATSLIMQSKRKKNQKRRERRKRRAYSGSSSNPNSLSITRSHEHRQGKQYASAADVPSSKIIDISDDDNDESDNDMDFQLALFNSCYKPPQVIDRKGKGILYSSPLIPLPHPRPRKLYAGESSVIDCVICKDTTSSGLVLRANNCEHPFCVGCFENYVAEKLQENIYKIECPEEKCNQVLLPRLWLQFVPERLLYLRKEAITESSVLSNPLIYLCPFKNCGKPIVLDEKSFLIKACPNCWKLYCDNCMVPWHMGLTCAEFKKMKERERLQLEELQIRSVMARISAFISAKSTLPYSWSK